MSEITLESLAARLDAIEKQLANQPATPPATPAKDWRRVAGMFTGSEFMKEVDAECAAAREAERVAARAESPE